MHYLIFSFHGIFNTNLNYSRISFKNHKKYCEKYGIDYLGTNEIISKYNIPTHIQFYRGMWMRFYIYELLDRYQRVMWVDSDVIFTNKCENIFQIVDSNSMGVVKDYTAQKIFSNNGMFLQLFKTQYQELYPIDKTNIKPYFNSGVLIVNKDHKELFDISIVNQITDKRNCPDQDYLNWMTSYYQYKMQYLPRQYNMTLTLEEQTDISKSKIIHCNRIGKNTPANKFKDLVKYNKLYGI